jgi:hypothetical protein
MPHQGKSFASGKHTISITLNAAEYAALKQAVLLQVKPLNEQDAADILADHSAARRFIRIATHAVALAALRAGDIPKDVSADLRAETHQEYRERIHLLLNPQDVAQDWFGCPPVTTPQSNTDFWKGFHRAN